MSNEYIFKTLSECVWRYFKGVSKILLTQYQTNGRQDTKYPFGVITEALMFCKKTWKLGLLLEQGYCNLRRHSFGYKYILKYCKNIKTSIILKKKKVNLELKIQFFRWVNNIRYTCICT